MYGRVKPPALFSISRLLPLYRLLQLICYSSYICRVDFVKRYLLCVLNWPCLEQRIAAIRNNDL